jgi:dihydrofolate reductase
VIGLSRVIGLIWAQSRNGVIGRDGALPWHIPEDLAHFRALTDGATVVMGRRTWESLPPRFRPLPGRRNVVLSRDPAYDAPGAEVVATLGSALESAVGDCWVIGGAAVYRDAMTHADRLAITDVDGDHDGDVHAPEIGAAWQCTATDPPTGWHTSSTGLRFRWRDLRRASE